MRGEELAEGTVIAGRYRVLGTAGSGGMGVVYEVENTETGARSALKIMRGRGTDLSVQRFRREARVAAMIESEHVVRIGEADVAPELDDAPFLVMELLRGEDLADRLGHERRLSIDETLDLLAQVARGLDHAHAAGVVHRDLKPQNIFLHERDDGARIVKLVDFGISRIQPKSDGREITGLTRAEDIFGTPAWMSPEQAMSMHHAVGPATDVWAVGLIAFRMLSGRSYWGDREAPQIHAELSRPERTPPSTIDAAFTPSFDRWFAQSCARDPARRFQSALAQVEALASALRGAPLLLDEARLGPHAPGASRDAELTPPTGVNHLLIPRETTAPTDIHDVPAPPPRVWALEVTPAPDQTARGQRGEPIEPELLLPAPAAGHSRLGSPWREHLPWLAPTVLFGIVFLVGIGWLVFSPDPPEPPRTAPPAATVAPRSPVTAPPLPSAPVAEPEPAPTPAPPRPKKRPSGR